jgi:hypothetical protein
VLGAISPDSEGGSGGSVREPFSTRTDGQGFPPEPIKEVRFPAEGRPATPVNSAESCPTYPH